MRNTLLTVLFTVGVGLVAGCGSKSTVDQALDGAKSYRDKMCACKDADCAKKVDDDYQKFKDDMKSKLKSGDKPSDEWMAQIKDVEHAYAKCNEDATLGPSK